jgi:hypothetical protein
LVFPPTNHPTENREPPTENRSNLPTPSNQLSSSRQRSRSLRERLPTKDLCIFPGRIEDTTRIRVAWQPRREPIRQHEPHRKQEGAKILRRAVECPTQAKSGLEWATCPSFRLLREYTVARDGLAQVGNSDPRCFMGMRYELHAEKLLQKRTLNQRCLSTPCADPNSIGCWCSCTPPLSASSSVVVSTQLPRCLLHSSI